MRRPTLREALNVVGGENEKMRYEPCPRQVLPGGARVHSSTRAPGKSTNSSFLPPEDCVQLSSSSAQLHFLHHETRGS